MAAMTTSAPSPIQEATRRLHAADQLVEELQRALKDKARRHESVAKRESELRNRLSEVDAQIANITSRYDLACRQQLTDREGEDPALLKSESEKLANTRHGVMQLLRDAEQATRAAHEPVFRLQTQVQLAREEAELCRLHLAVNTAAEELVHAREEWDRRENVYRKAQSAVGAFQAAKRQHDHQRASLPPGVALEKPHVNPEAVNARNPWNPNIA